MTKVQVELIMALFTGQQLVAVHLANKICELTGKPREDMAGSFRNTSQLLPSEMPNRNIIAMVLNHVADGIEGTQMASPDDIAKQMAEILH